MAAPRHQEATSASGGFTLILGAGAIGRLWAASLPPQRVRFIPRDTVPAARCCEYRLQAADGNQYPASIPYCETAQPLPRADCLLVTTKAADALPALERHITRLPRDIPVVLFQNGMGSQQRIAARWPERPILAAVTTEGANNPSAHLTIHAGRGQTSIGSLTPNAEHCLPTVVRHLQNSRLRVFPEPEIHQRLWQKLIVNAGINPFTALLNCVNGDILAHPFYLQHIDPLCQELHQLMAREGLNSPSADALRETIETVARATALNTSSMRADVLKNRPTEIDYINGYVASRGEALNLELATNRMLAERVRALTHC
ncbi:ketopantoate reductase family protein [Marinobacter mobilis]|uniref:2-dehydropantoate 2-reductase n=1 Tax=Marinobacter mobilis TaxID=488533 RepID=A0A1H2UCT0_9GAMM|nr:2-dehydropantoate 2-reductase [Marinobacter mobilis]SDW53982.1 ketopantoate reductase [Marinobacter mobilis]